MLDRSAFESEPGREVIAGYTFHGQELVLVNPHFSGCTFEKCQIVYAGVLADVADPASNKVDGLEFSLGETARAALEFIGDQYRAGNTAIFERVVESVTGHKLVLGAAVDSVQTS